MDCDYNIICFHRNALLPDSGSNKVSKPDLDTVSKPYLDITQCVKYLFNDLLNLNTNIPSSYSACKDYVTNTTLQNDRKRIQPGGISRKYDNRPKESHITSLQK